MNPLTLRAAIAVLAGWTCLAAPAIEAAGAESRGLAVRMRDQHGKSLAPQRLYGSSRALVIGIDAYTNGWPRLETAVSDAAAVARELERHGFRVTLKSNLGAAALDQVLKEFFAIEGADPEARLFLWFAGHGHTIAGEGFLVPADAPPAGDPAFKVKALHMRDFGGLVRLAEAKHVLSVFDSCFSGTVFASRSATAPAEISRKTAMPVRQFLTSGDAGQRVRDDGSFGALFLRALRGDERADANRDGYVTGDELGLYLSQEMSRLTNSAQTPRWGRLQDVRFNEGDFVFETGPVPGPPSVALPSPPDDSGHDADVAFWKSIKDSEDTADFEAYLARFPSGLFVDLARIRLARLEGPPSVPRRGDVEIEPMERTFVATETVNLREAPSVEARKLGSARRNAGIVVTGRVVGAPWYRLQLPDGLAAYVHADFVREIDPAELIAWYRVRQSDDPGAYRNFIRRFPDGYFRREAERIGRALYRSRRDARLPPPDRYERAVIDMVRPLRPLPPGLRR